MMRTPKTRLIHLHPPSLRFHSRTSATVSHSANAHVHVCASSGASTLYMNPSSSALLHYLHTILTTSIYRAFEHFTRLLDHQSTLYLPFYRLPPAKMSASNLSKTVVNLPAASSAAPSSKFKHDLTTSPYSNTAL
jgi:hypothetical protein